MLTENAQIRLLVHNFRCTDLFTSSFFVYSLRILASKYALRITIAKLRTEQNPDFLSFFFYPFGSFQDVFSLLKGGNIFTDP